MRKNTRYSKTVSIMMWFMAMLLVVFTAGCDREKGEGAAGPGSSPPTVPSVLPTDMSSGACINKVITATFSKAMLASTITATGTFTVKETFGSAVTGTVGYDAITMIASFTTTTNLTPGTNYTATISTAATDEAGTPLAADKVWSFTAGATTCAPIIAPGILAKFGIASYNGITDTGATKVNGDVVIDTGLTCAGTGGPMAVGSTNDFGPSCNAGANTVTNNAGDLVITQIYPDTTTADAVMVALTAKWNSITMAGTPGGTDLGCGTIGTGGAAGAGIGCAGNSTLPPGIYISATHSTIDITGDLTLDGQGDPNAVFVFQAPSAALTATPGSPAAHPRILLINGTKASNVWWQVGSSATIGSYTEFQGNVLASASISMGTGATSCGRLLSGAAGSGAFTFLGNTVSVPGHANAPVGCE